MRFFPLFCAAALLAASPDDGELHETAANLGAFEFFASTITLTRSDMAALEHGDAVVRRLPGHDGQLGVFAATRLNATADVVVAWARAMSSLKQSAFVPAARPFSVPAVESDLEELTLEEAELDSLRSCRPGACALKLSAEEIATINRLVSAQPATWQAAAHQGLRRALAERVNRYRSGGLDSIRPADRRHAPPLTKPFEALLARSPFLSNAPALETWLRDFPGQSTHGIESRFYWSKERYGAGKPVIAVTHVGIWRPPSDPVLPDVVVVSKQIFAAHYVNAGLGVTALLHDRATGVAYLAYVNRSHLDVLDGLLGGIARGVIEARAERDAPAMLRLMRSRMESGYPSADARVGS